MPIVVRNYLSHEVSGASYLDAESQTIHPKKKTKLGSGSLAVLNH
jgi:hypothetical protein